MIRQRAIYISILAGFMGACTHKTSTYNFGTIRSMKLDESKVILTRFPSQLEAINDSIVGAIHSEQTLSLYNINSGKNTANFSINDINFDSLIRITFQKKYEGERKYTYSKNEWKELAGMYERISLFQHFNKGFYIYTSAQCDIDYLNDSTEILKYYDDKKLKELKRSNKNLHIMVSRFVHFLLKTDEAFKIKEIIPLYDSPFLKKNKYEPLYFKGSYVDKESLHFVLLKNGDAYETRRSKKDIRYYYTAVMDINDQTNIRLLLNNNIIDYSGFSYDDYFGCASKFYDKNGQLLFFNGREICDVKRGKKIFSGKNLKSNEWVKSFYINEDGKIVMFNYNVYPKKHPTDLEKAYAVDSLDTYRIKVFDTKTLKWIAEKPLDDSRFPILITKDKMIYLSTDKKNYYFNIIPYHEN